MTRRRFKAMGTDVELIVEADRAAAQLDAAEAEFHRLERLLTRFDPGSELSRLNEQGSLEAGPDLLEVVRLALAGRAATEGRFDPTVHDAVVRAGLRPHLRRASRGRPRAGGGSPLRRRSPDRREPHRARSRRPARPRRHRQGLRRRKRCDDPGRGRPVPRQRRRRHRPARRRLDDRRHSRQLTLELEGGGLATSGRDRRAWRRDGRELHHLIDPATGEPAACDLLRATVVAPDAIQAEIWAKALFLAGSHAAAAEADAQRLPCVLVTRSGETRLAGGLG